MYGVVTEVPTVEQDLSIDGMLGVGGAGGSSATEKEKDERKKVRVCRDCLNTVLCVVPFLRFSWSFQTDDPPSSPRTVGSK